MALDFDGANENVTFGTDWITQGALSDLTIAMWIYPDSLPGNHTLIIQRAVKAAGNFWIWATSTVGLAFGIWDGAADGDFWVDSTAISLGLGTWHFVAVSFDSATKTARVCINGTFETITLAGGSNGSVGRLIASRTGSYYLNGKMDELGVWNREFSDAEVLQLYRSKKRFYSGANCKGLYHFDEQSGTTLHDYSGAEIDGTTQNMEDPGDWVEGYPFSGRAKAIQSL